MDLRSALADSDLTTLRLRHDWRADRLELTLAREWDEALDFSSGEAGSRGGPPPYKGWARWACLSPSCWPRRG